MNKKKALYIALLLIPLVVVAIAGTPGSVIVISEGETYTTNYMVAIEGSPVGWCAPVAVLLDYIIFAMAALYGPLKKPFLVTCIGILSFLSACAVVTPILVGGDIQIVPNVLTAILLLVECVVARSIRNSADQRPEPEIKSPLLKN